MLTIETSGATHPVLLQSTLVTTQEEKHPATRKGAAVIHQTN